LRQPVHCLRAGVALLLLCTLAGPQQTANIDSSPSVEQATLIEAGSFPFHLKAAISEKGDPTSKAYVEIYWVAPDKWRRTIRSQEFSQTLVVNGSRVFEQDSDDYFPLGLQTLAVAMVDPRPVLQGFRPGDTLLTKANGASTEDGVVCYSPDRRLCSKGPYGLREVVGSAGHSVDFTDYRAFHGKRVARLLAYVRGPGDSLNAEVTELSELKDPKERLFSIDQPTVTEKRIRSMFLPEAELRSRSVEAPDIIWPQVLDGATTGNASIYVSLDRSGRVREAIPVRSANERANESACRQIMKWKFKPVMKDGSPVQAEALLTFTLNTRAWGPPSPLNDAEARKLAGNIVEPVIPPGTAPAGTTYTLRAAIDYEGRLIEVIGGGGAPGLFMPCYRAVQKWQFKPLLQDGEPRPYRAEITFRVP
jgi:Gram-negative bacterial TonB protein C-terminal